MQKAGDEPARIADKLKVSVEEVGQMVRNFEAARAELSQESLGMHINAEVFTAISGVGSRLHDIAHKSKRFSGAYDDEGKPIYQLDDQMSIEAVKIMGELAERVMPKSGGAAINIGINNGGNGGNGSNGQVKTFEQRVREKRGVLPDGDVKFLPDGKGNEIVDGEIMDDDDDDDIIDDMADGTSDAEIEEADEARD